MCVLKGHGRDDLLTTVSMDTHAAVSKQRLQNQFRFEQERVKSVVEQEVTSKSSILQCRNLSVNIPAFNISLKYKYWQLPMEMVTVHIYIRRSSTHNERCFCISPERTKQPLALIMAVCLFTFSRLPPILRYDVPCSIGVVPHVIFVQV